jgi:V8-like Glu-specific endopeptidase
VSVRRAIPLVFLLLVSSFPLVSSRAADHGPGFVSHRVTDPSGAERWWTAERMREAEPLNPPSIDIDSLGPAPERGRGFVVPSGEPPDTYNSTGTASSGTGNGPLPFSSGEIPEPDEGAFAAHGRIFGESGSATYSCSATALTSDNKSVVWTAAHCVYLFGEFSDTVVFVPGYDEDDPRPYGNWAAEEIVIPPQWKQREDPLYDFAAFRVGPNEQGELLGDVIPTRGIAFNQEPTATFQSFGYPLRPKRFDGGSLRTCVSQGSGRIANGLVAMGCDMRQGSSGGGWVIHDRYVASNVTSGNHRLWPNVSFGPYLGEVARTLYDSIRGGNAPMPHPTPTSAPGPDRSHPMKLTLDLDRHLVASGRLTAADGFRKCARTAPVFLVRIFRDGSYTMVGRLQFTGSDGRFRTTIPDRKGRYAAAAEASPFDLNDFCEYAESSIERHRH